VAEEVGAAVELAAAALELEPPELAAVGVRAAAPAVGEQGAAAQRFTG
jgi:hypothetical protein